MAANYAGASIKETIGGPDEKYEDNFILSQTQHIHNDDDNGTLYATMMLKNGVRIMNLSDKSVVVDTDDWFNVKMPAGMCFHGEDKMLLCDLNDDNVVICNRADCKYLETIDLEVKKPTSITKDHAGNIYLGEVGEDGDRLRCFDADWKLKYAIKSVDNKDLTGVNYVAFDHVNSRILASDMDANAVHVFSSSDGTHVFTITCESPCGIAVDHCGNILVCSMTTNCVQVYDSEGKFLTKLGSEINYEELFKYPMDVQVKSNKQVMVVDGSIMAGWSRVQIFEC